MSESISLMISSAVVFSSEFDSEVTSGVSSCGGSGNGSFGVCVTYSNKINPDHHRLHTTFSETNGGVCNPTKGQPFTTLKS